MHLCEFCCVRNRFGDIVAPAYCVVRSSLRAGRKELVGSAACPSFCTVGYGLSFGIAGYIVGLARR